MKKGNVLHLYKKYHVDRNDERLGQFTILAEKYNVKSALYPGSFVHITPSFVFPVVTYVDTDKRAESFFKDPCVSDYISKHKTYDSEPAVSFIHKDYRKSIEVKRRSFDLLISQYAGFVSQYCKEYLRNGGILLVNNSHGDAGMASIDNDFILIGILTRRGAKYTFSDDNLNAYFIPKKPVKITKEYLEKIGRGIGYTKSASAYLFRKIN